MPPAAQQNAYSADTTTKSPTSMFGNGEAKVTRASATGRKRKTTAENLPIVTIDEMYDTTVIVGSVGQKNGQKAFRVNKGSLRNVSTVWATMLNGKWKESAMAEITFPDDNCDAFMIVLAIAHFKLSELPAKLSRSALVELAILADKYELHGPIRMGVEAKGWMEPYHRKGTTWPPLADMNDIILITPAFGKPADLKYLANRVAMEAHVDDAQEFYLLDASQNKIFVRSDAPAGEICKFCSFAVVSNTDSYKVREIRRLRSEILSAWIATCAVGFNEVTKGSLPPCRRSMCAASKAGVLLLALQNAGLFPIPNKPDAMRRSVLSYWNDIKSIGTSHKPYRPCARTSNGYNHTSSCSFEKCFGDFGIINDAEATLARHAHPELWKQWETVCPCTVLS